MTPEITLKSISASVTSPLPPDIKRLVKEFNNGTGVLVRFAFIILDLGRNKQFIPFSDIYFSRNCKRSHVRVNTI